MEKALLIARAIMMSVKFIDFVTFVIEYVHSRTLMIAMFKVDGMHEKELNQEKNIAFGIAVSTLKKEFGLNTRVARFVVELAFNLVRYFMNRKEKVPCSDADENNCHTLNTGINFKKRAEENTEGDDLANIDIYDDNN